jgi:hypothetical protein
MTASPGPKAVRAAQECVIIDAFKYHPDYFLNQLIINGRYPEGSLFAILFKIVYLSGWLWLIGFIA